MCSQLSWVILSPGKMLIIDKCFNNTLQPSKYGKSSLGSDKFAITLEVRFTEIEKLEVHDSLSDSMSDRSLLLNSIR